MIRLVASDMDGTLLPTVTSDVSERMLAQIEELHKKGILFCAASGRHYLSLLELFKPVADKIAFVCENGASIYYQGKLVHKTIMPRNDVLELIAQINAHPDCVAVVSGLNGRFLFVDPMTNGLAITRKRYLVLNDISELPSEVIKISAFCKDGMAQHQADFMPAWENRLNVALSSDNWLDFSTSHKGTGLAALADICKISADEIMVFGDNYNDIGMFEFAGTCYAMENAVPSLHALATHSCAHVEDVIQKEFSLLR